MLNSPRSVVKTKNPALTCYLEKEMAPHSSILGWEKSHVQGSLAGYMDHKELDKTEHLSAAADLLLCDPREDPKDSEGNWSCPWTSQERGLCLLEHRGIYMKLSYNNTPNGLMEKETALISHASKVMLKILQARLQQYVNWELWGVQTGFRKGRGTRGQITNTRWITEEVSRF